ncbi:MAG TPA: hypothetical protein VNB90_01170 [Cytophagaceae bacterium]|nr:hypothetical protein [Cytophagaceae bacterium]
MSKRDSLRIDKRFYFNIGVGYNFVSGTGETAQYKEYTNGSFDVTNVKYSYGKGASLSVALGKMINKNLGFEVKLGYMGGGKNNHTSTYYDTSSTGDPYALEQDFSYFANTFFINPQIVLEAPFSQGHALYSKVGYLVGAGKATLALKETPNFYTIPNQVAQSGEFDWAYTGGLVSGSTLSLGIRLKIDNTASFFMEATGNSLHRTFTETHRTKAEKNKQDILNTFSKYNSEIDFVSTASEPKQIDYNVPRKEPAYRANYSSAGFRIGFQFYF